VHIEQLVKMANEIAAFFANGSEPGQGPQSVAAHLHRYWDPRMRKQIVEYLNDGGADLAPLARSAVEILAGEARR
jgi:formate dehydrogenase subunit delta